MIFYSQLYSLYFVNNIILQLYSLRCSLAIYNKFININDICNSIKDGEYSLINKDYHSSDRSNLKKILIMLKQQLITFLWSIRIFSPKWSDFRPTSDPKFWYMVRSVQLGPFNRPSHESLLETIHGFRPRKAIYVVIC